MFSFFKNLVGTNSPTESISRDLLEEKLIECDVAYELVEKILETCGKTIKKPQLEVALLALLKKESFYDKLTLREISAKPQVWLIFGVNGAGKTTTIAKIANLAKKEGKKVVLGAGDTFRAAAVAQLCAWGERLGVPCISAKFGADPSAVAFDTISAAKSRGLDVAIIDTAGRLDNKINLQNELIKISNTCTKALEGGDFYKILVLDGTQGTQAINQARVFNESLKIDGAIITKLDGASKGGSLISIMAELRVPILFVGTGECAEDFLPFDLDWYLKNLLDFVFAQG